MGDCIIILMYFKNTYLNVLFKKNMTNWTICYRNPNVYVILGFYIKLYYTEVLVYLVQFLYTNPIFFKMLGQSSSFKKFGMAVGAVQVLPMTIKPPFYIMS